MPESRALQEAIYQPTVSMHSAKFNCFLYFSASVACLTAFCAGNAFGWSSPMVPKLKQLHANPIGRPIDSMEESLITSLVNLGAAIGPIAAGILSDRLGRKKTLLLMTGPIVLSLLLTAFAHKVFLFYLARLIVGFSAGSIFTVLPMYLGEIAEDHNRGILGCLMGVFVASGLLFSFVVGPSLCIKFFSFVCLVPVVIFAIVFTVFIPESPQFLASKGRKSDLVACLTKLRDRQHVEKSAAKMMAEVEEHGKDGGSSLKDLVLVKRLRKGLIIALGLVVSQQFSGISIVLCYMQSIFESAGTKMAPETSTMIVGVVQVLTVIGTSAMVDRLGRKPLLLVSALGSAIALVALGAYFYLKSKAFDVASLAWLPVASLLVYIVVFNIGLGPLPFAVMAELFPQNVRSIASTFNSSTCFFSGFVLALVFPTMSAFLGPALSFWLFGMFAFVGFMFIWFILPETKGKSLHQIQLLLEGYKN